MLWRLKPDLVIELGTSGGGSAVFFAHVMQQYNKHAKVCRPWESCVLSTMFYTLSQHSNPE
jgi:hypothetical protein